MKKANQVTASAFLVALVEAVDDFINAYNYGRRLKTLKGLTRYEFICKQWTNLNQPQSLTLTRSTRC